MSSKCGLIEPNEGDKRYVRRDEDGQFTESDDLNRFLSRDNDQDAEYGSKPGHGDQGDRHTGDETETGCRAPLAPMPPLLACSGFFL